MVLKYECNQGIFQNTMVIPDFLDNLGKPWNLFSTMVYIKVPCYYLAFWTFTISKSYLFKDLGVPYKY